MLMRQGGAQVMNIVMSKGEARPWYKWIRIVSFCRWPNTAAAVTFLYSLQRRVMSISRLTDMTREWYVASLFLSTTNESPT